MQVKSITYTFKGITSSTLPTVLAQWHSPAQVTVAPQQQAVVDSAVVYLRDGEVILYKRKRSKVWQCKYKLFTGAWVRVSTRKTNRGYAEQVACNLYDEAR